MESSFTQRVKEEVVTYAFSSEEEEAFLAGFIMSNGVSEEPSSLKLQSENPIIAKKIYQCITEIFRLFPKFSCTQKMKLGKNIVYELEIEEKAEEVLSGFERFYREKSDDSDPFSDEEILRAFIAGVFVASGSVNSPKSENYHLQMTFCSQKKAKFVLRLLRRFKENRKMDFKLLERKKKGVLYLKKSEQITAFLALINATEMMLSFANSMIEKDFLNNDNRYQICFNANYRKMVVAANKQIEDILSLKESRLFVKLSEKEQAVAEIRLENPETPLSALSDLLRQKGVEISKSGVDRSLKKIHEMACAEKA